MTEVSASTISDGELHLVQQNRISNMPPAVVMTLRTRHRDGSWSPLMEFPRPGRGAALANVNGVLQLMSSSGSLTMVLHLMTWQNGTWSAPVETAVLPQPGGDVARLASPRSAPICTRW